MRDHSLHYSGEAQPAYIVSAYKRPDLLQHLLNSLSSAPISLHVDAKVDISTLAPIPFEVELLSRHVCHWGLFGHVAASLEGLSWFITTHASHAILLTGQCYPLVSQRTICEHLTFLGDRSQMELQPMPIAKWGNHGGMERIDRYHAYVLGRSRKAPILRRQLPYGLKPYGGGGYWCISRKHAAYIINIIDERPDIIKFFKSSLIPDEIFFHTILANSPYCDEILARPINFSKWKMNRWHPEILSFNDIDEAHESGALFARKFDEISVLYNIDERIGLA